MNELRQQIPVSFSGQGGEYFRIWIVNLCLSILTLGIYSAWAKVRRTQYFYRHTSVAGASFDYHGNPVAILKGRIIALTLFVGYSVASNLNPIAGLAVFAVLMAVMPWLLVRSYRFKLHNASYRGLRFSFHGSTGDAYVYFLLLPLASYVSLGFLWPLAHQQITRFIRNNSRYGNGRFAFQSGAGAFYVPYLIVFGVSILLILAAIGLGAWWVADLPQAPAGDAARQAEILRIVLVAVMAVYIGLLLFAVPYLGARLQNVIWNNTSLGPVGFVSTLRARDLFGILISNLLLIILTLGLFKPFADLRLVRYRMQHLSLLADADLDAFIAEREQEVAATGEEMADLFDLDISI